MKNRRDLSVYLKDEVGWVLSALPDTVRDQSGMQLIMPILRKRVESVIRVAWSRDGALGVHLDADDQAFVKQCVDDVMRWLGRDMGPDDVQGVKAIVSDRVTLALQRPRPAQLGAIAGENASPPTNGALPCHCDSVQGSGTSAEASPSESMDEWVRAATDACMEYVLPPYEPARHIIEERLRAAVQRGRPQERKQASQPGKPAAATAAEPTAASSPELAVTLFSDCARDLAELPAPRLAEVIKQMAVYALNIIVGFQMRAEGPVVHILQRFTVDDLETSLSVSELSRIARQLNLPGVDLLSAAAPRDAENMPRFSADDYRGGGVFGA